MICQGLSHIHIPLRENVFDDILSCVNKFDLSNVEDGLAGDQNNEKRRKCKLSWLAYDETVDYNRKLYSILWDIGKYYALQMGVNNWKIEHIESIQYTSYDVGDHYNWHVDVHPHTDFRRKLSGIILLNDDYTGGEIDLETKIQEVNEENVATPVAAEVNKEENKSAEASKVDAKPKTEAPKVEAKKEETKPQTKAEPKKEEEPKK